MPEQKYSGACPELQNPAASPGLEQSEEEQEKR